MSNAEQSTKSIIALPYRFVVLFSLAVLGTLAFATAGKAAPSHAPLSIPSLEGSFEKPCAVATNSAGDIYVTDVKFMGLDDLTKIKIYDSSGAFLTQVPFALGPCDLDVDSAGNIFVTNAGGVAKLHPSSPPPVTASTTYTLEGATFGKKTNAAAVDPRNDHIFVSESGVNERQTYPRPSAANCSPSTEYVIEFEGQQTSGLKCENATSAAQIQSALNALSTIGGVGGGVSVEGGGTKIVDFNKGSFINKSIPDSALIIRKKDDLTQISVSTTTIQGGPSKISEYLSNGTFISSMGSGVGGASYFGVDVYGANGNVYATDVAHNKVIIFDSAGTILKEIDGSAAPSGAFTAMEKAMLAVDQSNGNVLVSDIKGHGVVDEFNAAGDYLTELTHSPAFVEAGPSGLAVSSAAATKGNVYVTSGTTAGSVFSFGALEPTKTLTTSVSPPATGTITCNGPAANLPSSACASQYAEGSALTLYANPAVGYGLEKWEGCDSTAESGKKCLVTMSSAKSVTAFFEATGNPLKVVKAGGGTGGVTSDVAGINAQTINCGSHCEEIYVAATVVKLTPAADPGSAFSGWTGCDAVVETDKCEVTMSAAKTVTATFGAKPAVTTEAATGTTKTATTLNGKVNPNGFNVSDCHFEYSTEPLPASSPSTAPCVPSPGSGSAPVSVSASVSGLTAGTLYNFRLIATNSVGTTDGSALTVTTNPLTPPIVTTTAGATNLRPKAADVAGAVNPNGLAVETCEVEYGTTESYGSKASCASLPPGTGSSPLPVGKSLSGLTPGQLYHFRFVATNADGKGTGADQTFTTEPLLAPVVVTGAAGGTTKTTATLNGTVNPKFEEVSDCHFEYGTTESYGQTVPCSPANPGGSSDSATAASAAISGLSANTDYHFRLVATNAGGTTNGSDQAFKTTLDNKPIVTTTAGATNIAQTTAKVAGTVNPNGLAIETCKVEYGISLPSASKADCVPMPGSGTSAEAVTADLSGLTAGTTYKFRFLATNSDGEGKGAEQEFTTLQNTPTVTSVAPNEGPAAGGQLVTITGTNLTGATKVEYGTTSVTCTGVVATCKVESATEIKATTPAHAAGSAPVTVTTAGGTSASSPYTFVAAPTLTSCAPNEGPVAGGTSVTCTGTNFVTGATSFSFGANPATSVNVTSATSATMSAPVGSAGAVTVTATTAGGSSGTTPYTYVAAPTVTSVSPNEGPVAGGQMVTITGTNLTGATKVEYGTTAVTCTGVVATCKVESATEIKATTPVHAAGSAPVKVTTVGGTSAASPYTYVAAPTVTSVAPAKGPLTAGTVVTITGTNLGGPTGVKFGAAAATAVTPVSSTQVKATAPAGSAGTVDVTVTTTGGTSATNANAKYTYVAPLALTVGKAGTGGGSVTCDGGACAASYPFGAKVTLAASPDASSTFAGFSGGGCAGTGSCVVTLEADTSVTATFTAKPAEPKTCATDPSLCPLPSNEAKPGAAKQQGEAIELKVAVPGGGTLVATGKNMVKATMSAKASGTVKLKLKLNSAGKKQLKKKGKVKVKVKVVFTPTGGSPGTTTKTVTFKKKK